MHRGGEHRATINSPSGDRPHWVAGRSLIAILSASSVSIPQSEIRFYLIFHCCRGWSGNLWGWQWASMIIRQPFVNHLWATSKTVKYMIFGKITHRLWVSTSIRSSHGDTALLCGKKPVFSWILNLRLAKPVASIMPIWQVGTAMGDKVGAVQCS